MGFSSLHIIRGVEVDAKDVILKFKADLDAVRKAHHKIGEPPMGWWKSVESYLEYETGFPDDDTSEDSVEKEDSEDDEPQETPEPTLETLTFAPEESWISNDLGDNYFVLTDRWAHQLGHALGLYLYHCCGKIAGQKFLVGMLIQRIDLWKINDQVTKLKPTDRDDEDIQGFIQEKWPELLQNKKIKTFIKADDCASCT